MRENVYQAHVIRELKSRFPDCVVLKNDSSYQQGIPDLLFLWRDRWACFEVKPSATAAHQPNQDYWVETLNHMSFAAFLHPDNEEQIFDELAQAFQPIWN